PPGSARQERFSQDLLSRINGLPGVKDAAISSSLPMLDMGVVNKSRLTVVGRPPEPESQKPFVEFHGVGLDYFRVMGMRLRAGRGFTERDDAKAPPVIVINETLARRHFAGEDPIGKRVLSEGGRAEATVVGVVDDVKRYGLEAEVKSEVYGNLHNENLQGPIILVIRAVGDPMKLVPIIRRQISAIDPN